MREPPFYDVYSTIYFFLLLVKEAEDLTQIRRSCIELFAVYPGICYNGKEFLTKACLRKFRGAIFILYDALRHADEEQ